MFCFVQASSYKRSFSYVKADPGPISDIHLYSDTSTNVTFLCRFTRSCKHFQTNSDCFECFEIPDLVTNKTTQHMTAHRQIIENKVIGFWEIFVGKKSRLYLNLREFSRTLT